MLSSLPDSAVDAFLTEMGPGSTSSLLLAELRQLGGALGRPHPGAGSLPMLDGQFALFGVAIAATPDIGMQGQADAHQLAGALSPYSNGTSYLNFTENPVEAKTGYTDETWMQLKAIRSMVDPDGVFVANHKVPRLYENGKPSA